jgi:hypothetical protein
MSPAFKTAMKAIDIQQKQLEIRNAADKSNRQLPPLSASRQMKHWPSAMSYTRILYVWKDDGIQSCGKDRYHFFKKAPIWSPLR